MEQSHRIAAYLNRFSDKDEFGRLDSNLQRLGNIYENRFQPIFSSKDSFIWFTLFERFNALSFEDTSFAGFLRAFQDGLCRRKVAGECFVQIDRKRSANDKATVMKKLTILETLLYGFLHIP